jgi:hypothetical protein
MNALSRSCKDQDDWGSVKPSRGSIPRGWRDSSRKTVDCRDWAEDAPGGYDALVRGILEEFSKSESRTLSPARRAEFEKLADQWTRETIHESQIRKKVAHPAYLRIIGMGKPVLPLLVEALRDRPNHWFPALKAIANTDPARDATNPSAARDAWLLWASAEGLLP